MLKWYLGLSAHLRTAIIIAPLLFVFGWGGMDFYANPNKPKAEEQVRLFPLQQRGDCLLQQSGSSCAFEYAAFQLTLSREQASSNDLVRLVWRGNYAMRGIQLTLVRPSGQEELIQVNPVSDANLEWQAEFPKHLLTNGSAKLRMVIAQIGKILYLEVDVPL